MRLLTVLLMFVLIVSGCGQNDSGTEDTKNDLYIYTSIYPLQYFAERIGGDNVKVKSIIPPGTDGHTYEPTTKELIQIAESDLLIYNGAGFEGFVTKAKKALKEHEVSFLSASAHINEEPSEHEAEHDEEDHDEHQHGEHEHGEIDPHLWLDPIYAIEMAHTIKDEMVKHQPGSEEEFEANFNALKNDLEKLDQQFKELVKNSERKEFIVAHSAYGNWEERYGLKQISVSGVSPSHEPSQKEAQAIIEYARENDVPYIIFEKNITSDVAEMIQKEVEADVLYLNNLESLSQEQIDNNEDYISVMEENIATLKKALN